MAGYKSGFFAPFSAFVRLLSRALCNLTIICKESDFPTQDATTITGESGKHYLVVFPITTSKEFIGTNCEVSSIVNSVTMWTYTGTGIAMQNTNDSRVKVTSIAVDAPNGTTIQVNGVNDGVNLQASERFNLREAIITGKFPLKLQGAGALISTLSNYIGTDNQPYVIDVNATNMLVFNMRETFVGGVPAGGAAIKLNNSTAAEWEITDLIYSGDAGGHVMDGLTNSGNTLVGGQMIVKDGNFQGSTVPLNGGISVNDVRNFFYSNPLLDDSQIGGFLYLSTATSVTVEAQDTFYPIEGVCVSTLSGKFIASGCKFVYIGETPIYIKIDATVSADSGGSRDISIGILKSGSLITGTDLQYKSNQLSPSSVFAYTRLVTNDEIQCGIANNSGTQNFSNVESMLIRVFK